MKTLKQKFDDGDYIYSNQLSYQLEVPLVADIIGIEWAWLIKHPLDERLPRSFNCLKDFQAQWELWKNEITSKTKEPLQVTSFIFLSNGHQLEAKTEIEEGKRYLTFTEVKNHGR